MEGSISTSGKGKYGVMISFFEGWRGMLTLGFLVALILLPNLTNGFVYDDDQAIRSNPIVQNGDIVGAFTNDFWGTEGEVSTGTYRPLVVVSFAMQWLIGPKHPAAFQLVNIILAVAVALLVYRLFILWLPSPYAWFGAAFFALHPANSEVLHSLVQRSELLAALFMLASLLLLLNSKAKSARPFPICMAILCFACAMLSKESALITPVLLVLIDRFAPGGSNNLFRTFRKHAASLALMALIIAVYFPIRIAVLGGMSREVPYMYNPTVELSSLWQHLNSGYLILRYLLRAIWPIPQPMEWTYNQMTILGPDAWIIMLAAWCLLLLLAYLVLRELFRNNLAALGIAWFVLSTLLVVQAIVTVTVIFADRCLFFPSIGFALTAASLLYYLRQRKLHRLPVAGIAVALITLFAFYQINVSDKWKTNFSFFQHLAINSPHCANARLGFGKFLYSNGQLDGALSELHQADRIYRHSTEIQLWLGKIMYKRYMHEYARRTWARLFESAKQYELDVYIPQEAVLFTDRANEFLLHNPLYAGHLAQVALKLDSSNDKAWNVLLRSQILSGNHELLYQTIEILEKRNPDSSITFFAKALYYENMADFEKALKAIDRASEIEKLNYDFPRYRSDLLFKAGKRDEAIRALILHLNEAPNDEQAKRRLMRIRGATENEVRKIHISR